MYINKLEKDTNFDTASRCTHIRHIRHLDAYKNDLRAKNSKKNPPSTTDSAKSCQVPIQARNTHMRAYTFTLYKTHLLIGVKFCRVSINVPILRFLWIHDAYTTLKVIKYRYFDFGEIYRRLQ